MPSERGRTDRWTRRLFRLSVVLAAFGAGMYVAQAQAFPWGPVSRATKTALSMIALWKSDTPILQRWRFEGMPPDSVEANRVAPLTEKGLQDAVVLLGGRWTFIEHCPEADGCLAVEYAGRAQPGRTWSWRSDVLDGPLVADPLPVERTPGAVAADQLRPMYATPFANGDLLVSFLYDSWHYPSFAGVGRLGRDGRPAWFRADYSHHEGHVGAGDTVWIAGATLEEPILELPELNMRWECDQRHIQLDRVHVLDENGALADSVSILSAFRASRWRSKLVHADDCDPFHLNSVSFVGEDVSGLADVRPGDLVLSFKHLNAFAIVGRTDRMLKRYVTGTFVGQHSAKHLRASQFLVFDNVGGSVLHEGELHLVSRVLLVDAASGEETVVFPKDPQRWKGWFTTGKGRLSISPDRTRVLASYGFAGRAVEVSIADGRVLAEFNFLHDMQDKERFPADSAVVRMEGQIFYAHGPRRARRGH